MSTFSFDLTGVSDEWPVVPEGVYNAKVTDMHQYTKQDTGNIVFVVDLALTQKGEWQDERVRYYQTYVVSKPAMAKRNLVRFLRALGVVDDSQTSGDPSKSLKVGFVNGKTDEEGRIQVKAIRVNDKETSPLGLRCNVVSKPRLINSTDGKERMVTSIDSLEPYAAVRKEAKPSATDLWSQFPK